MIKGDSQWFPQTYTLFVAYICKCIICQQEALKAGEIKVSTVTAVHKAALCSQTLLYHALQWYENTFDFETCSAHVYSTKSKLLENLFVAVSFDIVVGCHKYINVRETLYSITFANILTKVTKIKTEDKKLQKQPCPFSLFRSLQGLFRGYYFTELYLNASAIPGELPIKFTMSEKQFIWRWFYNVNYKRYLFTTQIPEMLGRFLHLNKMKTKRLSNHMSQYFIQNRT